MNRKASVFGKLKLLNACLAFLLLTAPVVAADKSSISPVPQAIGALQLEQVKSGEEARAEINKLHGKSFLFLQSYVARYRQDKKEATLWMSIYESEKAAKKELAKMAGKLEGSTGSGFQHFQRLSIEGIPVNMVTGMGQVHYFFQKGKKGLWLAVDSSEARQAIRDLVRKMP